jgi:hypothetical protein
MNENPIVCFGGQLFAMLEALAAANRRCGTLKVKGGRYEVTWYPIPAIPPKQETFL